MQRRSLNPSQDVMTPRTASLERRLPLMISGLLALSVALFGLLAFTEVRDSSMSAATAQLRTIALQTSDALSRTVTQRFDVLLRTAASPAVAHVFARGTAHDTSVAATFLRTHRSPADSVALVSQMLIAPDGTPRLTVGDTLLPVEAAALHTVFNDAVRRDSASIGPPFAVGGEVRVWAVAPSRALDTTTGYLAEFRRLRTSPLVAQQIKGLTGKDLSFYYASDAGTSWSTASARPIAPQFDLKATPDSFRLVDVAGREILGIQARVKGTPWIVVISMTGRAVALPAMQFLRRMFASGLLLLAVGLVGAWFVSRRVTEPLISLTKAARAVADGNFDARQAVTTGDELGQLSAAFNSMAQRVGESHRELTRANQAKSEFLAMMSHELRTPLSAIAGYAEILQLGLHGDLNTKQRTDVERIQANQVHLLRIISDILDLSQVESGQLSVAIQPVHMREVVADLDPIVLPLTRERAVDYSVQPEVLDLVVHAERERLTQVLVNLVANAARFTASGGHVTLHAERVGDRVRLHVSDAGIGIRPDKQELIFQPFVQLDGGPSRQAQGTGLGLAISRRMAEAMGGSLSVTKSEIGKGTTFTLDLAAAPGPDALANDAQSPFVPLAAPSAAVTDATHVTTHVATHVTTHLTAHARNFVTGS
jgi:signal transduction histidine kinase